MEIEIPPLEVNGNRKKGRPKIVSWQERFDDLFNERLRTATGEKTFEAECRYLANVFNEEQKTPAIGEKKINITAKYVRELAATRGYTTKKYNQVRWMYIDRYLKAGRAFLAVYDQELATFGHEIEEPLPENPDQP